MSMIRDYHMGYLLSPWDFWLIFAINQKPHYQACMIKSESLSLRADNGQGLMGDEQDPVL